MKNNLQKKIVAVCMLMIMMVGMSACSLPIDILRRLTEPEQSVGNRGKSSLYENHTEFIDKVKENLNVPDSNEISYNVSEPTYKKELDAETVYISFVENGEIVATAECYTEDGGLARSVRMYSEDEEKPAEKPKEKIDYQNVSYEWYSNSYYGYSIPYPDFLIPQSESGNGAYKQFISEDNRVVLTVGGSMTPKVFFVDPTIEEYYEYVLDSLTYEPTFKNIGENFFVFSGYIGNDIIYEKYILKSDGTENSFSIRYPSELKSEFDPIVTYLAKKITTGIGAASQVKK